MGSASLRPPANAKHASDTGTLPRLMRHIEASRERWLARLAGYIAHRSSFVLPEAVGERTRVCLEGGLVEAAIPHHRAMAEHLADDLRGIGLKTIVGLGALPGDEVGVPFVRARTPGEEPVGWLFSTHYDVVAPGPGWREEPFSPTRRGDRLYGRGAADAKGPLAAMVCALEALADQGLAPAAPVELVVTGDEEIGGRRGVRSPALQGALSARAAVVGEPSGREGHPVVAVMTRGRAEARLSVDEPALTTSGARSSGAGMSGHSGLRTGDTPLETLIDSLFHLRRATGELEEVFAREAAGDRRWPGVERLPPTLRILGIHQPSGVESGNVIGAGVESRIELRFHPPLTGEILEDWLRRALGRHAAPGLRVTFTLWNDPAMVDEAEGWAQRVRDCAEVAGLKPEIGAFPAGSDMSPLVGLHRIPTVIASAIDLMGRGVHGPDEWVGAQELIDTIKLYATLMLTAPAQRPASNKSQRPGGRKV